MRLKRLHIAKSPCYPTHGIIVEYEDGRELWDSGCASGSQERTLELAAEGWPGQEILGFDHPEHYSNRPK